MFNRVLKIIGRLHWLRFGVRDRIIRIFDDPERASSLEFVETFYGYQYFGNKNNFIDWNVFYYGVYAISEILLIRSILSKIRNPVYIDVGANVGHHVLAVARLCERVIAFEPFSPVRVQLETKVSLNDISHVTVLPFGLSTTRANLPFQPPTGRNFGTGCFQRADSNANNLVLPVVNGDEALLALGLKSVDFVKVDVEGFEEDVLGGLKDTLRQFEPVVFFEIIWNNLAADKDRLRRLFPEGYTIYEVQFSSRRFGLFNNDGFKLAMWGRGNTDGYLLAVPRRFSSVVELSH